MQDVLNKIDQYSKHDEKNSSFTTSFNEWSEPKSEHSCINELSNNNMSKEYRFNKLNMYVSLNIETLEEWSGKKYSSVLYDSDIDGKDTSTFRDKIMNQSQLYFIVVDSENDVFGHYHSGVIHKELCNNDDGIFIFTLNSNGRSGINKHNSSGRHTHTYIY